MSFSLQCETSGLEYNGTSLNRVFAQRRNVLRTEFWAMLREILHFNRNAADPGTQTGVASLGEYLDRHGYSHWFREHYLVPIASALWSSDPAQIDSMPLKFFIGFMENHGMLQVYGRPQWRTIQGGSQRYVDRLIESFSDRIRLRSPVRSIRRSPDRVELKTDDGGWETFDQVILASHCDQSLAMLETASPDERQILEAIPYQPNRTILHTDPVVMPRSRRAWASWNYYRPAQPSPRVAVSYHMNRLQSLAAQDDFMVTLNHSTPIDKEQVLGDWIYEHPLFGSRSAWAQSQWERISGKNRTHFCGAYWGYGFHEDGVRSALRVCQAFGRSL